MTRKTRIFLLFALILSLSLLVIVFSLSIGPSFIGIKALGRAFLNFLHTGSMDSGILKIFFEIRFPRILLALFVGAALAVAGLIYQTILKNPLAEPFTLGISSGATLGVALGIFIGSFTGIAIPRLPLALAGGGISILVIFLIGFHHKTTIFTLLFTGIGISFFFNALFTLLLSLLGERSYQVLIWLFGSFQTPPPLWLFIFFGIMTFVGIIFLFIFGTTLDIFYFSDVITRSMGVNVRFTRILFFFIGSLLTIFAVSLSGVIGFIGLIVPHIARILFGNRHRVLIIASVVLGGLFTLVSDTIARTLMAVISNQGKEIPVGVVTALLGAPFFLILLLRMRSRL